MTVRHDRTRTTLKGGMDFDHKLHQCDVFATSRYLGQHSFVIQYDFDRNQTSNNV